MAHHVGDWLMDAEIQTAFWQAFPLLVVDTNSGQILRANTMAETVFGFDVIGGLQGHVIEDLLPEELRGRHQGHRAAYARDPYPRMSAMGREGMTLHGRRKNGDIFPVEVLLRPVKLSGRDVTFALVVDLSTKQRAHGERA
jgi:PAS domain S-box-containing protein